MTKEVDNQIDGGTAETVVAPCSSHCYVPYRTILIDPPWPQVMSGKYKTAKNQRAADLPYNPMTLEEMLRLPVKALGSDDAHLWLWTTNQFLEDGFVLMRAWGFKYLAAIHAIKPNGIGNYFVHRTQTLLFGYKTKCKFPLERYKPNIIEGGTARSGTKRMSTSSPSRPARVSSCSHAGNVPAGTCGATKWTRTSSWK